ncbi:uncharacterized protein FIBRA_07253 [Fibroporia radiculosa]|uniref:Phytocyanin domain-containing protein n=1 Tax=Fibroporia radiculosa TaxID=599839 RepID=J4IBQ1_9APHY|nr:uncharacterized protein FIBRA_07253 [Fibroporia radiculosa]CCM05051.1 predicted protein [Fibroporia radiculosa]
MFHTARFFFCVFVLLANASRSWAVQYQVIVGGEGVLKYNPEYVNANPGDTVVFSFRQENHTATQSTLDNPCEHTNNGFDSGFLPVAANNTDGPFPAAEYTVQDTDPVWVFCRQANHCRLGMVFAINPGDQFSIFQANAMGNGTTNSSLPSNTTSGITSTSSTITSMPSAIPSVANTTTSPSTSSATTSDITSVVTTTTTVTITDLPSSTSSSTSASIPTTTSTDHVVIVGGANELLTYQPSNITADIGDTVTFHFMQTNHTATQSSFDDPCRGLTETSTTGQLGFDSGFMPVASNATSYPTFTVQINDTSPIWVYCKQTNPKSHCGAGMVFSVNAVESSPNNFAAFQAKAKQINGTTSDTATTSGATTLGYSFGPTIIASLLILGTYAL